MIYDSNGSPTTGVEIDGEKILVWYWDKFGALKSHWMLCATATGVIEWRRPTATFPIGRVRTLEDGSRVIEIPVGTK